MTHRLRMARKRRSILREQTRSAGRRYTSELRARDYDRAGIVEWRIERLSDRLKREAGRVGKEPIA